MLILRPPWFYIKKPGQTYSSACSNFSNISLPNFNASCFYLLNCSTTWTVIIIDQKANS